MYEKIRTFCDDKGITIVQFESICGTSRGYMEKLKRHSPSVKVAKRIAQVMGITIDELLDGCDE